MLAGTRFLVTGSAGFIGFHLCRRLLAEGALVTGVDNFNAYYDVAIKERRNQVLQPCPAFTLHRCTLEDLPAITQAWEQAKPDVVIHLAAQAGVRYSIDHPDSYIASNLIGTFHVLQLARTHGVKHLLAASTSSAYGANTEMPFTETQSFSHPLTLYAATKGATELMGHAYANLFSIPTTFFRFFTVYGPWGRPDMALFKFADAILEDRPIDVYNNGQMSRDFTFIDDLVEAIVRLVPCVPAQPGVAGDSLSPVAPYRLVNIGGGQQTSLMDYIACLEQALGRVAQRNYLPMQTGDVPATFASSALLQTLTGFKPSTPVSLGVKAFVDWYLAYRQDTA